MEKNLIHKGSVKDVYETEGGVVFDFSDRYSIYDWGKMPDLIEKKGVSLSLTGMAFFDWLSKASSWKNIVVPENTLYRASAMEQVKHLQNKGFKHHALNLVDSEGNKKLAGSLTNSFLVQQVEVLKPEFENGKYDYSFYETAPTNALVPLEVIFRFGIPQGSSMLRRASNEKYIERLGLKADEISDGCRFTFPVIEFSTKLEHRDRYITYEEAQKIAGLHDDEFRLILNRTQLLALKIKEFFANLNIELWDGKFEFAFVPSQDLKTRDIMLVDSIGPDELRLTYEGTQLSKEVLRQIYQANNPKWIKALDQSKKLAKERKTREWKKICLEELKEKPQNLSPDQAKAVSLMYQSLCNAIALESWKKEPFSNVPSLGEIVKLLNASKQGAQA